MSLFGSMADAAVQAGEPGLACLSGALQYLSVALCQGNASQCCSGLNVPLPGVGACSCLQAELVSAVLVSIGILGLASL
jgi:hypothetical protein